MRAYMHFEQILYTYVCTKERMVNFPSTHRQDTDEKKKQNKTN